MYIFLTSFPTIFTSIFFTILQFSLFIVIQQLLLYSFDIYILKYNYGLQNIIRRSDVYYLLIFSIFNKWKILNIFYFYLDNKDICQLYLQLIYLFLL